LSGGEDAVTEREKKEWYSNQQLYEMMVQLSKRLEQTNAEMLVTQTMIRDYNGLRERLGDCEQRVNEIVAAGRGSKDMWGYIVGGIGLLFAILSQVVR
jgi:hypothetical protein